MNLSRDLTEQERMRRTVFECLSCGVGLRVDPQYPIGMPIPRTLELWCSQCKTTNVYNEPVFWREEKEAA